MACTDAMRSPVVSQFAHSMRFPLSGVIAGRGREGAGALVAITEAEAGHSGGRGRGRAEGFTTEGILGQGLATGLLSTTGGFSATAGPTFSFSAFSAAGAGVPFSSLGPKEKPGGT